MLYLLIGPTYLFVQDNISTNSDRNLFIGSSALQDSPGRFTWDGKYGKLAGNRPNLVKLIGVYTTPWNATVGAFFEYKDGDVWESFDGSVYGNPFSSIRFSEPAGSRREASHWQLDLNYTQNFTLTEDFDLLLKADIFNLFDKQTGYNYDPFVSNTTFGQPRTLINPRRVQLSVNLTF